MTEQQIEAYELMLKALARALTEIHNPGSNQTLGIDITGHIEEVIKHAIQVGPKEV